MPSTLCAIHDVPMRQFWKKDDPDHVGQSWFSHKLEDETWCNGKPKSATFAGGYTKPSKAKTLDEYNKEPGGYAGRPAEYWDTRSKLIGLCGLANAMLNSGKQPKEIDVEALGLLLQKLEKTAKELQTDSEIPF